jgi:hypothetical protein
MSLLSFMDWGFYMNTSAEFIVDIVVKLLKKKLSSNEYYGLGGSKNIFRLCVERCKGIGDTCTETLANLIIQETKYDEIKKKLVMDYLKQYLSPKELDYLNRNPNDIKTIVIFATSKFSVKTRRTIPDLNKVKYSTVKKNTKHQIQILTSKLSDLYEKMVTYIDIDPVISLSLSKTILGTINEYILENGKIKKSTIKKDFADIFLAKKIFPENVALSMKHLENSFQLESKMDRNYHEDFIDSCFSSLRLVIKWFLSEYLKSTYKIEMQIIRVPEEKKTNNNALLSEFRIVDVNELISLGWTLEEIVEEGMKIDFETIEDITIEHNGDFEQWLTVARENSETIRYLLTKENKLIGYWHFSPLFNDTFQKAKNGKLLDSEITIEKIPFLLPGTYNIYFIAICLKEIYRRKNMTFGSLLFSIIETIEEMADNKIYVNEICALAYSNSGIQLCNSIGLKYIRDHVEHGQIYCGSIYDLLDRPFCKNFTKLRKIYSDLKEHKF